MLEKLKTHILKQIINTNIEKKPFYHLFIENIFTDEFYDILYSKCYECKNKKLFNARTQDNANFINKRFNLYNVNDEFISILRNIFNDDHIKKALINKFFIDNSFSHELEIHEEFEFVFTEKNKFQNIHTDIPAKFLSFVFYLPEDNLNLSMEEQYSNGTILYDKDLKPVYSSKFIKNSVCVFAPHFYSYHGFNTTIDRNALVMFYINKKVLNEHTKIMQKCINGIDEINYFKFNIKSKLEKYKLIEYSENENKINDEYKNCKINAPSGRIML